MQDDEPQRTLGGQREFSIHAHLCASEPLRPISYPSVFRFRSAKRKAKVNVLLAPAGLNLAKL